MKIFHLTSWLSNAGGGIPPVIDAMARQMRGGNHTCSVLGLRDQSAGAGRSTGELNPITGAVVGPGFFGYSPELRKMLRAQVTKDSVIHVHGLWMYPGLLARQLVRETGASLMISPHGMLDPWALANARWKKRLAAWAYENRNLREAGCLHALCAPEAAAIRAYGLKNPVCVIPNGIEVPAAAEVQKAERKILLFLGRLHPKKGLANALRAWKQALHSKSTNQNATSHPWQFVVAGWDQVGHEAELKLLCKDLGLAFSHIPIADFLADLPDSDHSSLTSVIFTGSVFGAEKDRLLRQASAFILPSFSEGLPMSVLEAWAYGLPVLMTDHCNLPAGFAANAALRIGTDAESIAEGLRELFALPATDPGQATTTLSAIGQNGRALVERQFTWPQVAAQMKEVYEWLLGGGPKPGCVEG